MLIKVAPKLNSNSITNPTNFTTPKIHSTYYSYTYNKKYFGYKSIVIFIVEIAYLPHRFAIHFRPLISGLHSL